MEKMDTLNLGQFKRAAQTEELSVRARNLLSRIKHLSGDLKDEDISKALRDADWALERLERKASQRLNLARAKHEKKK